MKQLTYLIALLLTSVAFANKHSNVRHIYGDVDIVSTYKIEYGSPRIVIKSIFPQLESDEQTDNINGFNQLIDDFVKDKIASFTSDVEKSDVYATGVSREKIRNDLFLDYSASFIKSGKEPILSIRFILQGYIVGQAHPFHRYYVLNFNLHNGEELALDSLFIPDANYLAVLSDFSKQLLSQRLQDKKLIDKGTAPDARNFTNWNVKPNGLLITFEEGQVAPYVYGAQSVLIPFSAIKDMINPDSSIMSCVNNPRTCARSNVITGGFIDEAKRKTNLTISKK